MAIHSEEKVNDAAADKVYGKSCKTILMHVRFCQTEGRAAVLCLLFHAGHLMSASLPPPLDSDIG